MCSVASAWRTFSGLLVCASWSWLPLRIYSLRSLILCINQRTWTSLCVSAAIGQPLPLWMRTSSCSRRSSLATTGERWLFLWSTNFLGLQRYSSGPTWPSSSDFWTWSSPWWMLSPVLGDVSEWVYQRALLWSNMPTDNPLFLYVSILLDKDRERGQLS